MKEKYENSKLFWQNLKRKPFAYLDWEDRITYHQVSGFVKAYLDAMEYITGVPYYSKVKYWFLIKYRWELDGVWNDLIYQYLYKNNNKKSINRILHEMALFMKAEKSMMWVLADTVLDVERLCSNEYLQRTAQQRYDDMILHFTRFCFAPFAFTIHRGNPDDKYMTIFGYLVGFLYGMSHFSDSNYCENFKQWLFAKYSVSVDLSWPRFFLEIQCPDDKFKAASLASEEILLFFKEEVRF